MLIYDVEERHINTIKPGDVIVFHGQLKTVCAKDIKYGGFMGTTVFGDSYMSGHKKVEFAINIQSLPKAS